MRGEGSGLDEEELQWITAVGRGDEAQFAEFVRKYQGMVFAVCLKVTGQSNAAEDVAQEVFIKAFRALPSFRGDARFSTWLYQIAVRTCLDWKRAYQTEWRHHADTTVEDCQVVDTHTPEQMVVEREERVLLARLVSELQEPYRSITRWYYFEQLSYQDIANQTGLPLKTIESRLYRARRMMRERGEALR